MSIAETTTASPRTRLSLGDVIDREARRHRRRVALGWAALVGLVLTAAGGYYVWRPKPVPLSARFRLQPVTRGDVLREVHATGHAEALTTVLVGAEISGRIATVDTDFNQPVRAGQVLARFDRAALQAQVAQTAASLAAAKTALEQAKAELAQAASARERTARLHAEHIATDAELDVTQANASVAEQRVRAAEAQIAAQNAALTLAQTNLTHAEIRAPIDGVVITRNIDPGQSVASVLQAPTLFTVAADLHLMRVIAAVDEADIGEVKELQHATFTVNAYPERTFKGTVVEVRNSPVVVQDVVTYSTLIATENLDLALKPGMTASVRIRAAQVHHVLRVPNAALHFNPPNQPRPSPHGVWLLDAERLRYVAIHAGLSDGELTAIDAGDLPEGSQVIIELTPAGRKAYGVDS